jgi:prepilin peptidase CpaA
MNQVTIELAQQLIAVVLVLVCMFHDALRRRIPNVLTLPAMIIGLALGTFSHGWKGLVMSFLGILTGFALMYLPYHLGGMGAGDVKLMMSIGALLGPEASLQIFLYSALAGGVLAIYNVLRQKKISDTAGNLGMIFRAFLPATYGGIRAPVADTLRKKSVGSIPYGIAIALGTIAFLYFGNIV